MLFILFMILCDCSISALTFICNKLSLIVVFSFHFKHMPHKCYKKETETGGCLCYASASKCNIMCTSRPTVQRYSNISHLNSIRWTFQTTDCLHIAHRAQLWAAYVVCKYFICLGEFSYADETCHTINQKQHTCEIIYQWLDIRVLCRISIIMLNKQLVLK